jgi:hypothetical protein
LSGLGAGVIPKALANTIVPLIGRVSFGGAAAMVTNELTTAVGGDCPSAAPAELNDGSTVTEGTLCSLTVSSPVAFSTLRFECLEFEELAEKNQEKGRIQQNSATAN